MPSYRVNGSKVEFNIFDVVGKDGSEVGFIAHTGLVESPDTQSLIKVAIIDMGPPLHGPGNPTLLDADAAGCANLTDDETRKIKVFIDRHEYEHRGFLELGKTKLIAFAPQMYCVHPHSSEFREDDGRYARTRFSCAGFVMEAYRNARITLLRIDSLPMVDIETIKLAYPWIERLMDKGRLSREALGLEGEGPWPILFCGYLFHALNREPNTIRSDPYIPQPEDCKFL